MKRCPFCTNLKKSDVRNALEDLVRYTTDRKFLNEKRWKKISEVAEAEVASLAQSLKNKPHTLQNTYTARHKNF